jgi:hypothetical protein
MASAILDKVLDNFQDATRLIHESRNFAPNASRENVRSRVACVVMHHYSKAEHGFVIIIIIIYFI